MLKTIQNLPKQPGIYQFFDAKGKLLYIGKAKVLINRVKSYFRFTPTLHPNPTLGLRIQKMLSEAESLNYIVVDSEHDALILENSLIKQLNPKYNILLRDDKTYPYIYLDNNEAFARFDITRKIIKDKNITYFGPFSTGGREILDALYEIFPLVQKKNCIKEHKACLYYQVKKCLAPCEAKVSEKEYQHYIKQAIDAINNKKFLVNALEKKMLFYAEEMRFEEAAALRDQIDAINKSMPSSNIDLASLEDYDIFALAHHEQKAVLVKMFMRAGKIISSSHDTISIEMGLDSNEIYKRSILEFYLNKSPMPPKQILVFESFADQTELEDILSTHFEKKVSLQEPKRGNKLRLTQLAKQNGEELLRQESRKSNFNIEEELKKLFNLSRTPSSIECIDNSHMQGQATVSGIIAYKDNAFDKKAYRHYKLSNKSEYDQMREALMKRVENLDKNPPPSLMLIDGGETLLKLANDVFSSAGVNIDLLAIAKEKVDAKAYRAKGAARDIIHSLEDVYELAPTDRRLQFLQRLRDEAHRFAITFHKKTKLKEDKQSKLLNIKGIGPAKVKKLLNYFGTFENIYKASQEELEEVITKNDAKAIKEIL